MICKSFLATFCPVDCEELEVLSSSNTSSRIFFFSISSNRLGGLGNRLDHIDNISSLKYVIVRKEFLRKCERTSVLILDEFLLYNATEEEQQLLLKVMERRVERTTTIVCPQYDPEGWIERFGESAVSIHSGWFSNAGIFKIVTKYPTESQ